jgi:RNA polymerase sigma-70 factor (ECF subfamily)
MKAGTAAQPSGMNQEKFEELFSKYGRVVYRTAYGATGSEQDALDIQQTIFLRLIDNGDTLERVSNPKAYLCRAALNEARQHFRTRKRRKHSDDDVELLKDPDSDRNAGVVNMQERLLEALAQLDPQHAEILMLWSVHGYTDAQIAEMLGKKRGAVAMAMSRAKARLKDLLGDESQEGDAQ